MYSVGTPAATPIEHAAAAVLACGERAALSHGSALALYGLAKRWPDRPHVTAPTDRRPSKVVVHRTKALTRTDVRTQLGIRATSLARTLLDCAPTLTEKQLTRTVNEALRSPHLTEAQLADVIGRNPRHPGAKLLTQFVDSGQNPTRSDWEDDFPAWCERFGLPTPLINAIVAGREVDAYFEQEQLIVELDSWAFHRQHSSFESDRDRDADALVDGLPTVRITWTRTTARAREEADRLRAILARRRSDLARMSRRPAPG